MSLKMFWFSATENWTFLLPTNASLPDHLKQYPIFLTACNPPPATATSLLASTNIPNKCENGSFQVLRNIQFIIHSPVTNIADKIFCFPPCAMWLDACWFEFFSSLNLFSAWQRFAGYWYPLKILSIQELFLGKISNHFLCQFDVLVYDSLLWINYSDHTLISNVGVHEVGALDNIEISRKGGKDLRFTKKSKIVVEEMLRQSP